MMQSKEVLDKMKIAVNFSEECGTIRALNGSNFGPNLHKQKVFNGNEDFKALRIPYARLHDVPYDNPGMRLVDIQHIFGNWEADENDPRNYYFKQTDDYIRNIRQCGTDIIYRLGPSIEHSLENYFAFPPADMDKWVRICLNIVRHYNEGWANGYSWGIKYWEVWNEPNAKPHMWSGSNELYMKLYGKFALALKAYNPELKVGGPSLSCPVQPERWEKPWQFTLDFLSYCRENHIPIDFFTWHCYPLDLDYIIQEPYKYRKLLDEYGFKDAELQLNEWHFTIDWSHSMEWRMGLHGINGIESACAAANILSWWQDSPLTMGNYYTVGTSGGWGVMDIYQRKFKTWYALYAFAQMLDYTNRVKAFSPKQEISILAGKNKGNGQGAILISDYQSEVKELVIDLQGCSDKNLSVQILDENHDLEPIPVECRNRKLILRKGFPATLWLITGLECE